MKKKNDSLIIRGNSGEELIAFKPVSAQPERKLIPVPQNAASVLTNAGITTGLASISGNGLFRAAVNPATLMTYADGTVSSIVVEGGRIVQHAGFQTASSAAVFAPMLAFQVASMVTGQYYFNLLLKQMNHISKSINQIITYMEDKDHAVISETYNRLDEISIQMRCMTTDEDVLVRIHQYIDKVSEIAALYRILWEKKFAEYEQNTEDKTWRNFADAEFNKYWNILSGSLHVLAYARALEFVIRLERKANIYPSLQEEYSMRFREYKDFDVMGRKFYLPQSCQTPIEKTASCIRDIYRACCRDKSEIWISEKDRKNLSRDQQEAEQTLDKFLSENVHLSDFNMRFRENTEKVFRNLKHDNYLFFDAEKGQYYLEEA